MRVSFQKVLNSALNNSKSKEAHAFPKEERFRLSTSPACFRDSYDLSPLMMSSHIQRRDRTLSLSARVTRHDSPSPGPAAYSPKPFLEVRPSKVGPTFDQCKRMGASSRDVPGPGAYSPLRLEKRVQYSMGQRLPQSMVFSSTGPGKYNTEKYNTIDGDGRVYSKMSRQERFSQPFESFTPGPDQYAKHGDVVNQSFSFGREARRSSFMAVQKWGSPGPGQYNEFSEFAERRRQLQSNLKKMEKLVGER